MVSKVVNGFDNPLVPVRGSACAFCFFNYGSGWARLGAFDVKNWVVQEFISPNVEFNCQLSYSPYDGVGSHPALPEFVGWLVSFSRREDVIFLEVKSVARLVSYVYA